RFDLWEVFLLLATTIIVMIVVNPPDFFRDFNPVQSETEMAYFRERYGPDHNTEREEEWMIRDFFQDRRGGVFVDVGANHYQQASKTYYLEKNLGWSGLAIEPQQQYAEDYIAQRPRTKFFPFFVSDVSNETAKLYVAKNVPLVASSNREFVKLFGEPDEVRDVPTVSLTDLLDREGITTVDFLSMDIELHEPQALKGFDVARFKPSLVCIEGLLPVRQAILDYFAEHGYVLIGNYMWVDRENLYFTPRGNAPAAP
ncbi:MAG: FkbM family methyltransferase, partial [Vicinamibacterales bacterium]